MTCHHWPFIITEIIVITNMPRMFLVVSIKLLSVLSSNTFNPHNGWGNYSHFKDEETETCKITCHIATAIDWMCPFKVPVLKYNPQSDGIRRLELWGVIRSWGWGPHEWDQDPYKKDLRELPCPFHHERTQLVDHQLWTRKEAVTRHWICQYLDLELPSLQNCEK